MKHLILSTLAVSILFLVSGCSTEPVTTTTTTTAETTVTHPVQSATTETTTTRHLSY